jgi:hydrogenase expression/formation protein HypD
MKNSNPLADIISCFQTDYAALHCTLMEVCGTHTNVIRKAAIHQLLPRGIRLLSGPGCPVCVTGSAYIEQAIRLSQEPKVLITTFGDLLKVPGNHNNSLIDARANGGRIKVVYTPLDAVEMARAHPNLEVVFLGIGFETTAPVIALSLQTARQQGITNFSILPALKVLRPAMEALLIDDSIKLDGLIAPGHLSVITGADAFRYLPEQFSLPTVITGFQTVEIWLGLTALARQIKAGQAKLENMYPQAVSNAGNLAAQKLINQVFCIDDGEWRGLGVLPGSGLGFGQEYLRYDARVRFQLEPLQSVDPPGCLCGRVILGKSEPEQCRHFGRTCRPEHPVGPCMVSSEGTCAAHFYYHDRRENNEDSNYLS